MELIKSVDLAGFVEDVSQAVAMARAAHETLLRARAKLARYGVHEYDFNCAIMGCSQTLAKVMDARDWPEIAKRGIEALAWDRLFAESGVRSFMDQKAREDWDGQIKERKVPAITAESVAETFRALYEQRDAMMRRGLVRTFQELHPRYATNSVWQIGKKLILPRVFNYGGSSLEHTAFDHLDDLTRCFCFLEGVKEPDHRSGIYQQAHPLWAAGQTVLETPYMIISLHRTVRTAHAKIKRLDLLDRLNQILAEEYGNALPHDKKAASRPRPN